MMVVVSALALLAMPAVGQVVRASTDEAPPSAAALQAEYHRLSEELHSYAHKQAWPAVEQAYQRCLATGATLKRSDHFHAAHAARSRGDMMAVRERLLAALGDRDDREIIDWLWAIDLTYSVVTVNAFVEAELVAASRPFDPIQSRAIDFAAERLASTGVFTGLLPRGVYTAGGTTFELRAGRGPLVVDAPRPSGRKKRVRG
jgi:hypothetical protein